MTKEPYAAGHPLVAGETVTAGEYRCSGCGYELVEDHVTNLPVCPACLGDEWEQA